MTLSEVDTSKQSQLTSPSYSNKSNRNMAIATTTRAIARAGAKARARATPSAASLLVPPAPPDAVSTAPPALPAPPARAFPSPPRCPLPCRRLTPAALKWLQAMFLQISDSKVIEDTTHNLRHHVDHETPNGISSRAAVYGKAIRTSGSVLEARRESN